MSGARQGGAPTPATHRVLVTAGASGIGRVIA